MIDYPPSLSLSPSILVERKRPLSRSYPTWWHLVDPVQGKQSRRDKSGWVAVQRSVASLRKAEKVERLIFHYALFPSLVGRDLSGSVGGTHSTGCHSGRILKFFLIVFNLYLIFVFFFLSVGKAITEDSRVLIVGPESHPSRFRATKSSRAGQLEMPWKQNRYLILTKPRPHKRIFSVESVP